MASPPFLVEDQTDEDFFDKLVDDEFVVSESGPSIADGMDSDEVKAFSNLRIGETSTVLEDSGGEDGFALGGENHSQGVVEPSSCVPEKENMISEESASLVSSNSFAFEHVYQSGNDVKNADVSSESTTSRGSGSKNTGIKEVQWSSFYADSVQNGGIGSDTYSDFFTGFGNSSVDPFENVGDHVKVYSDPTSIIAENVVADSDASFNSVQRQDGQMSLASNEQTMREQELYNSQYWENHYPGWWYDSKTGEWHQVEGPEATKNYLESSGGKAYAAGNKVVSNQMSDVSYLQQTVQSQVGTVAEDCTTGSVSTWNQASQESTEYPAHMVFDPQYPGWYYDTIAQEWRALESYTSASPSTSTAFDQKNKSDLSGGFFPEKEHNIYNDGQVGGYGSQSMAGEGQVVNWAYSSSNHLQQNMNAWQPETVAQSESLGHFTGNRQTENVYSARSFDNANTNDQVGFKTMENAALYEQTKHSYGSNSSVTGFQNFVPVDNFSQQLNQHKLEQTPQMPFSHDYYSNQKSGSYSFAAFSSGTQLSYGSNEGRSSAGRPPHALVTFGFGGKLIVMNNGGSFTNSIYGNQDGVGGLISVFDLMDVVVGKNGAVIAADASDYFSTLCLQSFPGPLVGGSVGSKEVNKWIDERITNCESLNIDYQKVELLRLLLSLLKISCQHYGKLRSPFGTDPSSKESDSAESALANLFASCKRNGARLTEYGALSHCLHNVPSAGQMQATAAEVEKLLVSGRTKEALHGAQEGQLWGLALTLAAKLGDQYYVDTVKQMARHQFKRGSPLRTLCLLIAGQPAEVFSADDTVGGGLPAAVTVSNQHPQFGGNGMLDNWEENLSIITANRTEGDELVILHLGDCLWKERGEIAAAHICYLVADTNFESFSDSARLCLIGADHWKHPRTYASPDAIQRTELYEYSKVLGNSQSILLPFQPYKLVYAHMLAEVGKLSDSLKYCQTIMKSLKTGRIPEVDAWKQSVSLLEERIKTQQQGGFSANLAPGKLVGKLLPFIDRSIHRMIGPPPPPAALAQGIERDSPPVAARVGSSQSTIATQLLMPSSASMEPISEWRDVSNRMTMPNRSISEPDFGRSPIQGQVNQSNEPASADTQSKALVSGGGSRFGRFGSNLLQKTMGWVSRSRPDRQAKLGEKNTFYYDEKLKRWVEEGAEPPAEETALPPPPTTASFQNGNIKDASNKSDSFTANGWPEVKTPTPSEHNCGSGIPPIPPSSNQFSARGRMGVRSRYVDTFNKGGGTPTNLFQSPSLPAAKPSTGANAKFFIPAPGTSSEDIVDASGESVQDSVLTDEGPSTSMSKDSFFSSPPAPPSSSMSMQRFPSMNNISPSGSNGINGSFSSRSRRTASWSGGSVGSFSREVNEIKPRGEALGMPSLSFMPNHHQSMTPSIMNGGSFGDDLHEVEL